LFNYKPIIKINLFLLKILLCSYCFNCFAGKSKLTELELAQQQNYIFNSLNSFFETQPSIKKTTVNHIFSPYSLESCLATYSKTQLTNSEEKNDLDNRLIKLGINPDMPLSSGKEDKLQLLTAILTRDEVNATASRGLKNIFIGEHILAQDDNAVIINYRQVFKEKIQKALAEKFTGNLNLDYQEFWSPAPLNTDAYLKVLSAIKFQDYWKGKPFESVGLDTFYTKDNKEIQTDFIEKDVLTSLAIDKTSNWQAVRIFYQHNYAIDIILPFKNEQTTNENKKQIIYSLISQLNQNKPKDIKNININMPKFECKQKNCLDNYTRQTLAGFRPNYRGFLRNYNHINLVSIFQDCYIKIDETGTTAEAMTRMDIADGQSRPLKPFKVDRGYFFVLSEYQHVDDRNSPFKIKNIIMIGEVGNPSEQLIVPK
jgi:serine protease inhibitor